MEFVNNQIPPNPPAPSQIPPISLAEAIRRYLNARRIWETLEGRFVLNDEVSKQVRRDTLRFGIVEKYRVGV